MNSSEIRQLGRRSRRHRSDDGRDTYDTNVFTWLKSRSGELLRFRRKKRSRR